MTFSKVLNVKSPERGHDTDAGLDFFVPENSIGFIYQLRSKNSNVIIKFSENGLVVKPHQRILIPSGIKMNIPEGTALFAHNKSGVSTKYGLDVLADTVDSGYEGQIHISLVNTSSKRVLIKFGTKIIQFVHTPIISSELVQVPESELYIKTSARSDNGFGSTGV